MPHAPAIMPPLAFALVALAVPALGDEIAPFAAAGATPLSVTVSYTINAPVAAPTPEAGDATDRRLRRSMYSRAMGECEDLLATIAKTCVITGLSVNSQVNSYPGQPTTVYVSTSVTMQIEPK